MNKRISLPLTDPAGYRAIVAFKKYLETTQLTATDKHLINIRASQVNGCAYCVDLHSREARNDGETEQRLYSIVTWRETPFFTDRERAILALTEEVTLISNRVSDESYSRAAELLGEVYLAQVIMAIIVINGMTRIGIATNMQPSL
jgi:AhpD family alkylhydroperoxidase